MTTEIPVPQIQQSLRAAMAEWGRHHRAIGQIDGELAHLDGVVDDLRRQLADATNRHADLGRTRKTAEDEAAFARGMVEHGCRLAGIDMPEQPPAAAPAAAPAGLMPVQLQPPTSMPRDVSGDPFAIPANRIGDPAPLPPAAEAAPSETVTEPAALEPGPQDAPSAGGDQPAPGFQPEPTESRRRRVGGRRA